MNPFKMLRIFKSKFLFRKYSLINWKYILFSESADIIFTYLDTWKKAYTFQTSTQLFKNFKN